MPVPPLWGTLPRVESRVVGLAGLGPGTPVGARGSPGPRGEPGKKGFLVSTLGRFHTRVQGSHARGWPMPTPSSPVSGWRGRTPAG